MRGEPAPGVFRQYGIYFFSLAEEALTTWYAMSIETLSLIEPTAVATPRRVLQMMLQHLGVEQVIAKGGEVAVEVFAQSSFDLILGGSAYAGDGWPGSFTPNSGQLSAPAAPS
jgi:hypothetical protein